MLKCLLIRPLALKLLCVFQMSNQIMDMSDFSETLITLSLNAKTMLLNMWLSLMIFLTMSAMIGELASSKM